MELTNPGVYSEAAAQGVESQLDQQSYQQEAPAQEQHVPLSALQAERRERQQLQENLKLMQDHISLLQANHVRSKPPEDDGLRDDDVLTVGEAKRYLSEQTRKTDSELAELRMQQTYSDYAEIVKTYLPEVLKEDPELRDEIQNARNPFKLAYKLAKKSDGYQKFKRDKMSSPEATKAIANSHRPGNLSSVGSVSPASQVNSYKSMSDADFMKQVQKNLGYS